MNGSSHIPLHTGHTIYTDPLSIREEIVLEVFCVPPIVSVCLAVYESCLLFPFPVDAEVVNVIRRNIQFSED